MEQEESADATPGTRLICHACRSGKGSDLWFRTCDVLITTITLMNSYINYIIIDKNNIDSYIMNSSNNNSNNTKG